jgi:hypothetical protein
MTAQQKQEQAGRLAGSMLEILTLTRNPPFTSLNAFNRMVIPRRLLH